MNRMNNNFSHFMSRMLICITLISASACMAKGDYDPILESAENGSDLAQSSLGEDYLRGSGNREKNYKKAIYWFEKAAGQNNKSAQYHYGLMLMNGRGVKKQVEKGMKWLKKSADQEFPPAKKAIADMYSSGNGLKKDMNKAVGMYEDLTQYKMLGAYKALAKIYKNKELEFFDLKRSFVMWQHAAEWDDNEARHNLGLAYVKGEGVAKNDTEAIRWFELSAQDGVNASKNSLGLIYSGSGAERECEKAVRWYKSSAEAGYVSSQHNLGHLYEIGNCLDKDLEKAYFWLSLAANNGDDEAQESVLELSKVLDQATLIRINLEVSEREKR